MRIGILVPQGWVGEYNGWNPSEAWARTRDVAWQVESLGFESIWVYDHFHTVPRPTQEITFESFSTLAALVPETRRVRLGHVVLCAGYRNPALVAKMISTLDVISDGRMELGIGAGWKRDEWNGYGYGFPKGGERLRILRDSLEVIRAMMAPGPATYSGEHASVRDAINVPKPLQQPRVPIMVGGNGSNVTWRLAARYADELNVDGLTPAELKEALPTIRARCEEIGRDPATLPVSVHLFRDAAQPGAERVDLLGSYRELGVSRVMGLTRACTTSDEALPAYAEDARVAGAELAESTALGS
jgi:F420-dependent oxidoreductase-like protein